MIKTGPRRFKFGILVGVAVFLSGAPGYAQDIENSKLNSYTVVGPPEASVSSPKQNSYAVVGTPDANMSASKHNSYAVVGPPDANMSASKQNSYMVIRPKRPVVIIMGE